jgi:hypothetical protein
MSNSNVNWASLLQDAVDQPGILSSAYSVFHNYSIGNQMLAYGQLAARVSSPHLLQLMPSGKH